MGFKGESVLVTGGAGFIGSNLVLRLVEAGAKVTVLDAMVPDCGGNLFNLRPVEKDIEFVRGDLRDASTLPALIEGKRFIFNLAGFISHQDSLSKPLLDLEINATGHLNLLEACRRCNPQAVIVYTGTRQIYGVPQYLPVDEAHPVNPVDFNGISSFAGEHYHALYAKIFGLKTVCLRLTNAYGPRQLIRHARQGVIAWFLNRALTGQALCLFGGGKQIRDFNYVDDIVEGLLLVSQNPHCYGEVYNLSGERSDLFSLARRLVSLTGKGIVEDAEFPPELRKIDIGDYYGSSAKLASATGWAPNIPLEEGLRRTVRYFENYLPNYLE